MARAGLGAEWECVFANDYDPMKADVYRKNWGNAHFVHDDINLLASVVLPVDADMAWASFPCQDLSLAGNAAGLGTDRHQTRSGAFWGFWRLMDELIRCGNGPKMIVLENVYGSLTANGGRDFAMICRCLALAGYNFGAVLLDAIHFVAQSRPRVFLVAVRSDIQIAANLKFELPDAVWHPAAMRQAVGHLADVDYEKWFWLTPAYPVSKYKSLNELIIDQPTDVKWHTCEETNRLLDMMSPLHLAKLARMKKTGHRQIGTVYKRTRPDGKGARRQRAELRDDGVAGCLRTPGGGSSRQIIIEVQGDSVRSRLISTREAARLMGLPDSYALPNKYNDAYHVVGDGVVVPVVKFLNESVLLPTLIAHYTEQLAVAA